MKKMLITQVFICFINDKNQMIKEETCIIVQHFVFDVVNATSNTDLPSDESGLYRVVLYF